MSASREALVSMNSVFRIVRGLVYIASRQTREISTDTLVAWQGKKTNNDGHNTTASDSDVDLVESH